MFPSQATRDWWDDEVFLGLARLRGMECRAPYSEAFTCTKSVTAADCTCTGSGHAPRRRIREGARIMNVFVDPGLPAALLRQNIYDGDIVILTNLSSVRDLVDYAGATRGALPT